MCKKFIFKQREKYLWAILFFFFPVPLNKAVWNQPSPLQTAVSVHQHYDAFERETGFVSQESDVSEPQREPHGLIAKAAVLSSQFQGCQRVLFDMHNTGFYPLGFTGQTFSSTVSNPALLREMSKTACSVLQSPSNEVNSNVLENMLESRSILVFYSGSRMKNW